jgi:hypothetical protein
MQVIQAVRWLQIRMGQCAASMLRAVANPYSFQEAVAPMLVHSGGIPDQE